MWKLELLQNTVFKFHSLRAWGNCQITIWYPNWGFRVHWGAYSESGENH